MILQNVKYSNYFKFKAKIVVVPISQNRMGIDPYPKYHMRALGLLEVCAYSTNPKSVDSGYQKDEESGLYLKNRTDADEVDIESQFDWLSINVPFWFHSANTYQHWVQTTMQPLYQQQMEGKYTNSNGAPVEVKENEDIDFQPHHFYKIRKEWAIKEFDKIKFARWPKSKNTSILKIGTPVEAAPTTTSTSGGSTGSY